MTTGTRVVAVVERDGTLRDSICRALAGEGLLAEPFDDGAAAAARFEQRLPDLAVIGSDVAGIDGLELCRTLRRRAPDLPIVLTVRGDEMEQAVFASGADDYLPRPFSINELLIRVKAVLRRGALTGSEPLAWEDRPLTLGPLTVDPLRLSAKWHAQDLALTVTEFLLLHALVRRAGVVKTRDQLMQEVYPGRNATDRVVDRHIEHLRAKFEKHEPSFDALEGVHNAGYRYRAGPPRRA